MFLKQNGNTRRRANEPARELSPRIARLLRESWWLLVVAALLSDLLLYLFGLSAWWWVVAGIVLVIAGYRRVVRPDHASDHPFVLGAIGFALVLLSRAALESIRLYRLPAALPQKPGGALGDVIGQNLAHGVGFNGATLL